MKRYCFALDLHDDPALIEEYKRYHRPDGIWPEVMERIRANGVLSEEIYLIGNRLVMILETTDDFSLESKQAADSASAVMQRWEELMNRFQKPLPQARAGEKWARMQRIFEA